MRSRKEDDLRRTRKFIGSRVTRGRRAKPLPQSSVAEHGLEQRPMNIVLSQKLPSQSSPPQQS
jgi:hypothetical protein